MYVGHAFAKIMMRLFLFLLLMTWVSCSKDVHLPPVEEPKLVIWGYLQPDSIASIRLSHTYPILDSISGRAAFVSDALVVLHENHSISDTLREISPGYYRSATNLLPKPSQTYWYEVYKEGFPPLRTQPDTLPEKPLIESYASEWAITGYTFDNVSIIARAPNILQKNLVANSVLYYKGSQQAWTQTTFAKINNPCVARPLDIFFQGYLLEDYSCLNNFSEISLQSTGLSHNDLLDLKERGMYLNLAYFSSASENVALKLGIFHEAYTGYSEDVNLFYEPVYLPVLSEGGYGHIFFLNTSTFKIDF
jgi:hypothetical protein